SNINEVWSYGVIAGAGDLDEDATEGESSFKDKTVISALYAEEGAKITLSGKTNRLYTTAAPNEHDDLERVVWAYNGKEGKATTISIDGHTDISTNQYDKSLNSIDIAIAAGTAVNLDEQLVSASRDKAVEDRAQVLVNYADLTDDKGSVIQRSSITGDILAAYEGYVDIKPAENTNAGINITGNILAGNNGIVKIDLGKGGSLTGRADDYGDASVGDGEDGNKGHQNSTYFNPAFSSSIYEGGAVNLKMGEGSQWNVTGQSWITSIETGITGSSADDVEPLPTIDLTQANDVKNSKAAGLTVYNFSGDSNFKMKLDGNNLNNSNMLYMKHANGNYYIELEDAVSADEINTALHDGLRFATVGKDSNVHFSVGSRDDGVFNVEYEVGQDNYDETVSENVHYNGSELTAEKPSDSTVKDFFGNEGTPVEEVSGDAGIATASAVMALAEEAEVKAAETQEDSATGAVNHKIIGISSTEISDGGKTVINMSRANYANAVYMDTLNKRQGEARFVGSTDHGVWVRLRHDNIGKEDAFRSHNTMVEVGIDQRDVHDYGEFHTGVALDYMNGSLDYHTVDGDGDIERYGIWFYTTYLGNDGQYADLILKYGHLKNDFGFNTKTQGEHVTGDYTNETASISAEYGWKFSNSHNYYIEPQAQLQYTYITGADYTTSQGSRVDLDSIHSLIGRVGFRAGKDFLDWEHPASFYLRADALHEFLGDQDIRAYDNTGVMDITYENDDTWYTVGLGMTVKSSDNTYFFIEGETALGADNEDTYTVSGGFKHSF
uniref:autotransporter family protein n=1 Tax=uncultured Succinatimonas sp. TaxID=1262973 RepID=UPI0025EC431D